MHQKWNSENISDQNGRVAIVTGSSSGIGFETARVLANKNAEVIIAVRNLQKGNKAMERIKAENANANLRIMELDLADLASVKSFVETFKANYDQLDLLINNAGVMVPPYSKTKDGFELQMGTNHLGHFALTAQLMDLLLKTDNSRVVNVSSMAHRYGNIDFEDLDWSTRSYKRERAYGDSKIANLYFTRVLSEKLNASGNNTIAASAHPGWTATDLQRHSGLFEFLNNFFAQKIEMGALPTLYAAVGPDVQNGDFYGPKGFMEMRGYPVKVTPNELAQDKSIAERLWQESEKLTNNSFQI